MMNFLKLVFTIIIGLTIIIVSIYSFESSSNLQHNGIHTTGRITYTFEVNSRGGKTYYARAKFGTKGNQSYFVQERSHLNVNDFVGIVYDPLNPKNAEFASNYYWVSPVVWIIFGLIAVLHGITNILKRYI